MFLKYGLQIFLLAKLIECNIVPQSESISDTFRQCLVSQVHGNLKQCLGMSAISRLQNLDSSPEFDLVDGLTLTKGGQEFRDADYSFAESDPSSLRSIMDTVNHVFSRRNMQWNMGFLYPGLCMRVAPSVNTGGHLEFALDPHREALNVHSLKEAGTGRLLARQFLVPFLLGFKFNIASLLPILFGILALLAKKALVVSKLALLVTSAFGLGSLLFGYGNNNQQYQQHYGGGQFNPGFGGVHGYRYPEEEHLTGYYRGMQQSVEEDKLNVYPDLAKDYRSDNEAVIKGRNFAWSVDEKKKEIPS